VESLPANRKKKGGLGNGGVRTIGTDFNQNDAGCGGYMSSEGGLSKEKAKGKKRSTSGG